MNYDVYPKYYDLRRKGKPNFPGACTAKKIFLFFQNFGIILNFLTEKNKNPVIEFNINYHLILIAVNIEISDLSIIEFKKLTITDPIKDKQNTTNVPKINPHLSSLSITSFENEKTNLKR